MNAPSTDLVIKIGLGVAVLGAVYWAYKKVAGAAGSAASAVGSAVITAANSVNPVNPDNVFATGVNKIGGMVSGTESWTLGGAIYDAVHPGQTMVPPAQQPGQPGPNDIVNFGIAVDKNGNPIGGW